MTRVAVLVGHVILFPFRLPTIVLDARGWQDQIGALVQVLAIACVTDGIGLSRALGDLQLRPFTDLETGAQGERISL